MRILASTFGNNLNAFVETSSWLGVVGEIRIGWFNVRKISPKELAKVEIITEKSQLDASAPALGGLLFGGTGFLVGLGGLSTKKDVTVEITLTNGSKMLAIADNDEYHALLSAAFSNPKPQPVQVVNPNLAIEAKPFPIPASAFSPIANSISKAKTAKQKLNRALTMLAMTFVTFATAFGITAYESFRQNDITQSTGGTAVGVLGVVFLLLACITIFLFIQALFAWAFGS